LSPAQAKAESERLEITMAAAFALPSSFSCQSGIASYARIAFTLSLTPVLLKQNPAPYLAS
jgi:hypothetical protein